MASGLVQGRLLARNTLFSILGQILPLAVALVTVPLVIDGLGTDRYGIWSLVAVVMGYFVLVDLGLGRATTQFVARLLGENDPNRIPGTVWLCLISQFLLGSAGALVLVGLTPFITESVLNIPKEHLGESKTTFYLVSASIPVLLCTAALSGVLEAKQRFDLVNIVRVTSNSLVSFSPLLGIWLGFGLPKIAIMILAVRLCSGLTYLGFSFAVFPQLRRNFSIDVKLLPQLLTYGGWVTVINVISPLLTWLDKFLIGALISVTATAYYVPAQSLASYLWIVPASLFATLFPAFSTLGYSQKDALERLCTRGMKYIFLILGPIVLLLMVFAEDLLRIWIGDEFARESERALQLLAVGFFLNSLAWMPSALLQGVGRPGVVAKIFILELPFYLPIMWLLIKYMGIEGAALAWAIRGGAEAVVITGITWRAMKFKLSALAQDGLPNGVFYLVVLVVAVSIVALSLDGSKFVQVTITAALVLAFGLFAWSFLLDPSERNTLLAALLGGKYKEISNQDRDSQEELIS